MADKRPKASERAEKKRRKFSTNMIVALREHYSEDQAMMAKLEEKLRGGAAERMQKEYEKVDARCKEEGRAITTYECMNVAAAAMGWSTIDADLEDEENEPASPGCRMRHGLGIVAEEMEVEDEAELEQAEEPGEGQAYGGCWSGQGREERGGSESSARNCRSKVLVKK